MFLNGVLDLTREATEVNGYLTAEDDDYIELLHGHYERRSAWQQFMADDVEEAWQEFLRTDESELLAMLHE